jgi:hypothetical protein
MRNSCSILMLLLIALAFVAPMPAVGTPTSRAGIAVRLSAGEIITRCVAFSEERISGAELLECSGLHTVIANDPQYGAFVCGIAGVGCPVDNCLCDYPPAYWQYWLLQPQGWIVSGVGASGRTLGDGDVDGWFWTGVEIEGAVFATDLSFTEICPSETPPQRQLWLPLVER